MSDTTVKYFDSSMSGAPSLNNTAGTLIGVLDACLVDGFGSVTLNSLVVASNVATATVSGGHQFAMIGQTGPVVTIAGANPSGLNGQWRITVNSATEFTFATTGIGDQTASGTITAKRSPAGFSQAFSGTNKEAYRSDDVTGTRLYLRVDDTGTSNARVIGYETMSGVDTGTGPFPTEVQLSGGGYVYKSSSATARAWALYSDGRIVYLFIDSAGGGGYTGGLVFGDPDSYVASDAYGCVLIASTSASSSCPLNGNNNTTGSWTARALAQTGTAILNSRQTHAKCASYMGSGGDAYPAAADNSVHLWPVEVWDGSNTASRGLMPGFWCPVHTTGYIAQGDLVENMTALPGRTGRAQIIATSYSAVMDLTGPWR